MMGGACRGGKRRVRSELGRLLGWFAAGLWTMGARDEGKSGLVGELGLTREVKREGERERESRNLARKRKGKGNWETEEKEKREKK
jgi:hypothetical protein